LPRTRQQIDDFILGTVRVAGCGQQQALERTTAGVEQLGRGGDFGKRFDDPLLA
jgi:hypothetical protein